MADAEVIDRHDSVGGSSRDFAAGIDRDSGAGIGRAPVIFLDVDGVLNRTVTATHIRLDADLVARLKVITDQSGACLVLSTFWREFGPYISYVLRRHSVHARVVGRTPGLASSPLADGDVLYATRSDEITAWLAHNAPPGFAHYLVLDDREDAALGPLGAHFVRTDPAVGLTDADVERALRILASPPSAPADAPGELLARTATHVAAAGEHAAAAGKAARAVADGHEPRAASVRLGSRE
ncbi:hypothetical protein KFE25_002191 [Diacronema lutheri]|uniref:Uncharacterized protein n=1 Tax=Diacronema lutheri TaxID=2081491 RepID=A0A8J5XVW2_DIALT|nr:hypothetical protein KFE25_002191 [Diacronema lutheri]